MKIVVIAGTGLIGSKTVAAMMAKNHAVTNSLSIEAASSMIQTAN